jgi:hypothetical protein
MSDPFAGRQLRRVLGGLRDKEVIIPRLRTYLFNPKFTALTIPLKDFEQRPPDGWFHPSGHPLWPERMLYYYLSNPDRLLAEPADINFVLAVTQGSFWHYFVQACLVDMDLLREVNSKAPVPWLKVEKYVEDPRLRSRGSTDGIINSDNIASLDEDEVFELKTMAVAKMSGCPRGAPDDSERLVWWRLKNPGYYAQTQEYMRMSGLRFTRVVILGLQSPFPMIELQVPYSYGEAMKVADKYARVVQAVADRTLPLPCCNVGSKEAIMCPARQVCPVGLGMV